MKKLQSYSLMLALLFAFACKHKETETQGAFTCPMHPTVQSSSPGLCPVCHMDLVAVSGLASNLPLGEEARLLNPVNQSIRSWASTVRPVSGRLTSPIETQATAVVSELMVVAVASRVQGRLEKVFSRIPYQQVNKGEVMATVYSSELVEAQAQHLRQNSPESHNVLEQLGFTEDLFRQLEANRSPIRNVPIISPITGFLQPWEKPSDQGGAETGANGMMGNETTASEGNPPSPGTAVTAGQELFRIFPGNAVALDLQVPAHLAGYLESGDSVKIIQAGKKDYLTRLQQFNKTQVNSTFIRIRANAANSGISIGTKMKAIIYPRPTQGIWVPADGVLDLGETKMVFIRDGDFFRPRVVETGRRSGQMIQIVSGVTSADEVARQAGTLLDSDALLFNSLTHEN